MITVFSTFESIDATMIKEFSQDTRGLRGGRKLRQSIRDGYPLFFPAKKILWGFSYAQFRCAAISTN